MGKTRTFIGGILLGVLLLIPSLCHAQVLTGNLGGRAVELQGVAPDAGGWATGFSVYVEGSLAATLQCQIKTLETNSHVCSDPNKPEPDAPTSSAYTFNIIFSVDNVEYLCMTSLDMPVCIGKTAEGNWPDPSSAMPLSNW